MDDVGGEDYSDNPRTLGLILLFILLVYSNLGHLIHKEHNTVVNKTW